MKQLLLIRHAKSSWADASVNDFARPLNLRGKSDAPIMAKKLIKKNITIDALISSPANRALTTAHYFAKALHINPNTIIEVPTLYHAMPTDFYEVIAQTDNKLNTIAVFSHNPGITSFANELTETKIMDMPTCAIYAIKVHCTCWKDFKKATKEFWFFDYPKLTS